MCGDMDLNQTHVHHPAVLTGELVSSDSSSSSFSLSGGDSQADDSTQSDGSQAEAAYPPSFLMQDCTALQGLDVQVSLAAHPLHEQC